MKAVLGIDTSNYRTSLALVSEDGRILADERILLSVRKGERGLRQQEALFQHVQNLPELMEKMVSGIPEKPEICGVSVSLKPRPVEGSYMPCFNAGVSLGKSVSALWNIPCFAFSHQEGHIEAAIQGTPLDYENEFLAIHNSGGTCELLRVGKNIELIGGSKDISFGQFIDRTGVALGLSFPSGEEMDRLALKAACCYSDYTGMKRPKAVRPDGLYINLSGVETHYTRLCEAMVKEEYDEKLCGMLSREIFDVTADALVKLIESARRETGITDVLMVGGVSASTYIGSRLGENVYMGRRGLCGDNAVGTALLGRKMLWD